MNKAMLLYAHLTDRELIEKVKSGESRCYEVLVRRHCQAIYRVARMYAFSQTDAEQLATCAFIEAFQKLTVLQSPHSFRTFITRLMIGHCLRKKSRQDEVADDREEPASSVRAEQSMQACRTEGNLLNRFERCLERLPVPLRSVYLFSEIDGFSLQETSYLLATTKEHVALRLDKARSEIRKSVQRWYEHASLYPLTSEAMERVVGDIVAKIGMKIETPVGAPRL